MTRIVATGFKHDVKTIETRTVETEEAQVLIVHKDRDGRDVYLMDGRTFGSYGCHCTANATEDAERLCRRFGLDVASRLVVTVQYRRIWWPQRRRPWVPDPTFDYSGRPLEDPRWERDGPNQKIDTVEVWRSDQNVMWERFYDGGLDDG